MTISHQNIEYSSEEVLVRKFDGTVNVEDIIESWEYLIENDILKDKHKGVINDISSCELGLNSESFRKLMSYLRMNPLLKKLKLAVVCDSAKNIVFPVLAEDEEELHVKPFSTFEAALRWILS